jgi:hypothetical protein
MALSPPRESASTRGETAKRASMLRFAEVEAPTGGAFVAREAQVWNTFSPSTWKSGSTCST